VTPSSPRDAYRICIMNTDRFIALHSAEWDQLDALSRQGAARSGTDTQALVAGYQRVSAHLSVVRTHHSDPALEYRLTRTIAAANAAIYGTPERSRSAIARFATETFPAAVWWHRRYIFTAALLLMGPVVLVGAWIGVSDAALEASGPEAVRAAYVETDFESYYSSDPAAQFASEVFFNNVQVAILAFAVGILLAVPTVYVLVINGAGLGVAAGLFISAGRWQLFMGLITPHGLLELAAIIVAGAAGLALGWSVIAPGDQPRTMSVTQQARRSATVIMGLILAFAVAGAIEGFVTGSGMPTLLRVGIGVVAFALFTAWVVVYGPAAEARGVTGALGERTG
jgi:uncharacterized membrane protein SpoIIM required for sporulation